MLIKHWTTSLSKKLSFSFNGKKMSKKKKIWIIVLILVLVIVGVVYLSQRGKKDSGFVTEKVERKNLSQTVSVSGEVDAKEKADLSFEISGKIRKNYVELGEEVKKGQLLVEIESGELLKDLESAKESLKIEEEEIKDKKNAKSVWNDLDPEDRRIMEAELEIARANVGKVYEQLKKTTILSPIDGRVIKLDVEEGETVSANQEVVTVMKGTDLKIVADVPESDITKIKVGQTVKLTFDALGQEEEILGKVSSIDPAATIVQDVVFYQIDIELDAAESRLLPGMSADADVDIQEKENVLAIPFQAVENDDGGNYVRILKKDNQEEKKYVELGLEADGGYWEVKSGLSGGEDLIVFSNGK